MSDDAIELVKRSYAAFAAGDRAAMEAILAPDFHFTSPYDNRIDQATYWERCWPGAGQGGRNTEIATVRDGQIHAFEVYFGWNVPHDAPEGGFIEAVPTSS